MPKQLVKVTGGQPLFDIVSYGRLGLTRGEPLSPAQIEQITRTVRGAPEVMIKVWPRDANNLKTISHHFDYIGRKGELELEIDEGEQRKGARLGKQLVLDWNLDLDNLRCRSALTAAYGHVPPKLVHKLLLSMPPGTPPQKLLTAARNFAREQFGGRHRYALVLHRNEPHPHVHMVVKAVSEEGMRLNIRKATLREWRKEFAHHLRTLGVAANATERAVRGQIKTHQRTAIYRATLRGISTHTRARVEAVARQLRRGDPLLFTGSARMVSTRASVEQGWREVSEALIQQGRADLAAEISRWTAQWPPPQTDQQRIAAQLLQNLRDRVEGRQQKAVSR